MLHKAVHVCSFLLVLWSCSIAPTTADDKPLGTGITGMISASGLDNPQYVLSFPSIQRLMLDVSAGPVRIEAIRKALGPTPVSLENLLKLGLLRREKDAFHLNYLLLTADDQRLIRRVAEGAGKILAGKFLQRRDSFQELFAQYPRRELRAQLAFALVAGFALNWDGLRLTTELGYRADQEEKPNGDRYLVHSWEKGTNLSNDRLFWGSHSFPGGQVVFTTFGDGPSIPRVNGVPDVFFGMADEGLSPLADNPAVSSAVRDHLIAMLKVAHVLAGDLMLEIADAPRPRKSLEAILSQDESLLNPTIELLLSTGYATEAGGRMSAAVVILTEKHQRLVDETLRLSREMISAWLREDYPHLEQELNALSPMKNGVPFKLAFSEVWHEVFGFTTKILAEEDFYADPYAPGSQFRGFVPIVWSATLYDLF
jgi:hypothetical protein